MISLLYVDDEQMLLDLCKIFLERTGEFQVQTESSVLKALNLVSVQAFDAIISDYQMPEMDGIEFLKRVRSSGSSIPFIIFTGRGREEVAIAALKEGADFYLQKGGDPITQFAELTNQIRQIVRQRKAETAVRENEQKYHTLFESANDAIFLMDGEKIIDCNKRAEEIYGRSREDLIGSSPIIFSPPYQPDGSPSHDAGITRINAAIAGFPQLFEWRHKRGETEYFDAEVSLNRMNLADRNILLGIIRDITTRKNYEIELQRKNEELAASYEEILSTEEELKEQYQIIAHSERILRESEEKLTSVLASIDDLVFTLDPDGIFQNIFRQSHADYYIPPEEFLGRSYREVLPPDLADLLGNALKTLKETGITQQITYSLPSPTGKKHYSARISRRLDADGELAGVTLVARDTTSQKWTEEALIESTAKLNAILQGSPTPQFVMDLNHQVIHWNIALEQYSGIKAEEVLGTSDQWKAFYPEKRPCMADLLLDNDINAISRWYEGKFTKSPLIPDAYNATDFFPNMKENGVWLSFTATLIRDQEGTVIGALETLEDITDEKRYILALAESESRYRGVIDNLQDIYYRSDLQGRLIMASPSMLTLFGYDTLDQCLGTNIDETFYANPADRIQFLDAISKTGSVNNYLVYLKHRDGTPIPVSTNSHIYYDAEGKPAGVEGTFRDITRQLEIEEKIRRSEAILNAVVQESPVPLFVINRNHQVMYWNKALEKYSGITADEVSGTSSQWRAFYPDERPCMVDLLIDENISGIREWYKQKYAPSALIDGAYEAVDFFPHVGEGGCWLYFTAAPIRDSEGHVIGGVEILQDITQQKKAEEEIISMTRFQESIIMNANVWLMVLDIHGNILIWNHAAEEISGYRYEEVAGESWVWKALYPDASYRHTITSTISRIITENRYLQDFETRIKTKSGEEKEILWNTRSINDKPDSPRRFVAIGVDITQKIQAEKALHESEATLQEIVNGSPIPQFVIDQHHRVIYWNKALEKYSRIPAKEIIGTNQQWRAFYSEKRPCIVDLIVDDDVATLKSMYPEHYERSSLIDGGYQAVDFFPLMGNEGSWLFFTAAPIRDENGRLLGALETLEDITERKKAELALMESEEQFRTLFTNANDAIFLHSISDNGQPGTFIEVNDTACRRLGYSRDELLTMSPPDIESDEMKWMDKEYITILQSRGHATYETEHLTHDNEKIPIEISAHVYEFKGEKMVLSIARDISERKRFEFAIQNTNKKLNLLSSITRHDILNQLTILMGYLDLSEEIADNTQLLDFISQEKKSAETITRQILFTRDYQTVGIQSPQWQNLKETIEKAAILLDTRAISLHVEVDEIEVFADPLLEKVFFNLIDNSLRYGKNLKLISITPEYTDADLILIYSDDGGGIPPEEKENIFIRKYFSNTGFGLFLSREILSITGLSIQETGVFGSGARFEILIPKGSYRSGY